MNRIGFFQDSNGDFSIMRLIFAIGMIWIMALTTGMAIAGTGVLLLISLFSAVSAVFVGLKLGQTQMENNSHKSQNK